MGQRHVCTFRHAQRAAYRTAISAAQTCLVRHLYVANVMQINYYYYRFQDKGRYLHRFSTTVYLTSLLRGFT